MKKERSLSLPEVEALPEVGVFSDVHSCYRSRLDNLWGAAGYFDKAAGADPGPQARFAIIQAWRDFTTNLSLDDFFQVM